MFEGDAIRSIENGFTLLRCSSNGESGIVNPKGKFIAREYTGHTALEPAQFQLPLNSHVDTVYTYFGIIFPWLCMFLSLVIYIYSLVPLEILKAYVNIPLDNELYSSINNIQDDLVVPYGTVSLLLYIL